MGGTGMVFAKGVEAIELNPANFGWASGWNLSIYEAGFSALGDGATVPEVAAIFGAEFNLPVIGETPSDIAPVIERLSGLGGLRMSSVSEGFLTAFGAEEAGIPRPGDPLPSIGIAIGPIGIRARSSVMADLTLSSELADLIGNGFAPENIQSYAVGDTGWRTTSFSEVTVSYGTTLGGLLSVGVGGRYVMGHGLVSGRFFEPRIDLNDTSIEVDAVAVQAATGTGYGLDVGLSLDLPLGFRAAASGTNIAQNMTWDEGLIAHSATYVGCAASTVGCASDFDAATTDFIDLLDRFQAEPIVANEVPLDVYLASQGMFEESYFPQVFRGGLGWQAGGTSLEVVGTRVSPRGRFTSPWDERVAVGVEQKVPLLTVRAGFAQAQDGLTAVTVGGGLRLLGFNIDVGGGKFSGDGASTVWDGYHASVAVQLKGGGM
jgi:hypothetical protein